ncbi:MAG: hypothetical protein NTV30_10335 [Chloroflexi bacterium]|nr:hypothetical protein [Chloroflexota bacterium]
MNTAIVSPLVQIVLCLILLILIIIKNKLRGTATRIYFLFLIGITIQGLLIFLLRASSTYEQATEWHKWIWFEIPFLNALMLHFSLTISKRKLHLSFVTFIYCIAVVFSIFSLRYMVISGIRGTLTDYQLIHGVVYYPSIVLSLMGMIFSTIIIWNYNRKSINAAERNRNSYIILGLIIYLVMILIGALNIWDVLASPTYPAAMVGNTAFCVLTTISIIKYHLLDINLILRRSLAFIIMSLILAVPYSIFYMLADVQNRPHYLAFLIPLLILTALLFHPIWLQILKLIDRWFYSPQYNIRQYIKSSQINVYDITDINTLAKSIATIINSVFLTRGVYVLTQATSGNYVITAFTGNK